MVLYFILPAARALTCITAGKLLTPSLETFIIQSSHLEIMESASEAANLSDDVRWISNDVTPTTRLRLYFGLMQVPLDLTFIFTIAVRSFTCIDAFSSPAGTAGCSYITR